MAAVGMAEASRIKRRLKDIGITPKYVRNVLRVDPAL